MSEFAQKRACRTACATLVLAGALATQGCFFGRSKKPPKPFVPPPVYAKIPPPPTSTRPMEFPPPAAGETSVEPGVDPMVAGMPDLPPPPPRPTPTKLVAPVKPPAAAVADVAPAPVITAPKPTAIFTTAERQQMNQEIDQSLGKVRAALARAEGRNLSAELTVLARQARDQMQNAEQTRVQDLVTAVSLAKRAESFATELVQRLP